MTNSSSRHQEPSSNQPSSHSTAGSRREFKTIKLSNGGEAIVDACDFEFLNQWLWRQSDQGYAIRTVTIGGKQYKRSMHRIIADAPDGVLVDHESRNRLDNRRKNLRFADYQLNAINRSLSKGRKYRGVSLHKQTGRFESRIKHEKKILFLGLFDTDEQAARAFDAKCLELRGDRAILNFPAEKAA